MFVEVIEEIVLGECESYITIILLWKFYLFVGLWLQLLLFLFMEEEHYLCFCLLFDIYFWSLLLKSVEILGFCLVDW